MPFDDRSRILFGEQGARILASARVCVWGLGGVGAAAAMDLVRSGVGGIVAVDFDRVAESNLNRLYFGYRDTVDLPKTDAFASAARRVNPDVDAQTHPYISTGLRENKFGIAIEDAAALYRHAQTLPHLAVTGVDCHIGSQLTQLGPFLDALERVLVLVERLQGEGIEIRHLDLGGGLGVRYRDEVPPLPSDYAGALLRRLAQAPFEILIEPGRAIAANAGVLLTRVEYLKHSPAKDFAVIDAAMNDLIRPALYQAWQPIVSVEERPH
ncbi:MAG TPA: ThiF family adenylyltransferase, partial [Spirochaetales bacterium]|nr:ThiF family adenylyltransferase [Spirochaetales bacterium]